KFINSIDKLIAPLSESEFLDLKPDMLLSLGGMVISKKIKQFFRKYKPKYHLHVDEKNMQNTFHCLKFHFDMTPVSFFDGFLPHTKPLVSSYQKKWLTIKNIRNKKHSEFLKEVEFSDLKVVELILQSIPDHAQLQLANSSVVRYTQLFDNNSTLKIFCNRGTSGIDGSTSTAVGAALIEGRQTVFVTGDISFFYDSNALWNNYIKNDFRIILINNGGGGIFKILPEPSKTNALDYFETPHNLSAKHLCEMYKFQYAKASNETELNQQLKVFFDDEKYPKLLEIFTPSAINDKLLKDYFKSF
ncbi:MAG TPA: 2-succinyl-5-enolpyruvyl-6-hydroxy-3-cyclohexene-1-carboxylate synthase, partial [Flavobacteriaceae bacterium]|nr:2-succinyl-5-enolpyruvyl-6-hydroxy-3-cyclohexene-1-carboxylate synthase [Flavobacteriaceae bacterium]